MRHFLPYCLLSASLISLSPSALLSAEEGHRPHPPAHQLLERFDQDGDGQLSKAERRAAREAMQEQGPEAMIERIKTNHPEVYARLLEQHDRNGDGEIDAQELKAAKQQRGKQGQDGKPDDAERRRKHALHVFAAADSDGDGLLNQEEFLALTEQHGKQGNKQDTRRRPKQDGQDDEEPTNKDDEFDDFEFDFD